MKYLVLVPLYYPSPCLSLSTKRLLHSMQSSIFYSYANQISGTRRERLLRSSKFHLREQRRRGRERGGGAKTSSFLLSIIPPSQKPRGEKEGTGFQMILDFTPPTKGLHGGPLETLPKGIPVTLAKYLRGNQERKDEGEIRNVNNPIATGLSVSAAQLAQEKFAKAFSAVCIKIALFPIFTKCSDYGQSVTDGPTDLRLLVPPFCLGMAFFYLFILLITSGASLQVRKNKSASNFYRRFLTQGAFKPKTSLCLEFCALKKFFQFPVECINKCKKYTAI